MIALTRLPSFGAIVSRYTTRFGLNALGRAYFLKTARHNLVRLASGEGTLGDLIATQFAGIAGLLHQVNSDDGPDNPPRPDAGSGSGAGGGSPDGEDPGDDKYHKRKKKNGSDPLAGTKKETLDTKLRDQEFYNRLKAGENAKNVERSIVRRTKFEKTIDGLRALLKVLGNFYD